MNDGCLNFIDVGDSTVLYNIIQYAPTVPHTVCTTHHYTSVLYIIYTVHLYYTSYTSVLYCTLYVLYIIYSTNCMYTSHTQYLVYVLHKYTVPMLTV